MGGIIRFGKLLFTPNNVKYLGGVVNHLLEAYQANKIAQKLRSIGINQKSRGIEGPPQFEIKLFHMKSVDGVKKSTEKKEKIEKTNSKQEKVKTNNNHKDNLQQIEQLLPPTPPPTTSPQPQIGKGQQKDHGGKGKGQQQNDHGGRGRGRGGRHDHNRGGGRGRNDQHGDGGRGRGRNDHHGGRGRGGRNDHHGKDFSDHPNSNITSTISFLENDFPALSITNNNNNNNNNNKISWRCSHCTFQNSEYLNVCEMCNSNK